ncbi:AbrB family transcriptional regulator [Streptomyces sp. NPDC048551]|uniref:AbrB family transcriptional regulator n=1 Tax=Streptomyces sp. NPDC048551 TaxID=3155758 RepID=UPI00342201D4
MRATASVHCRDAPSQSSVTRLPRPGSPPASPRESPHLPGTGAHPAAPADPEVWNVVSGPEQDLGLLLLSVTAFTGIRLGRLMRLPSPGLLGPMLLAAAVTISGTATGFAPTGPLRTALFTIVGLDIGLRFTVLATAVATHADVSLISSVQSLRLFAMVLLAPSLSASPPRAPGAARREVIGGLGLPCGSRGRSRPSESMDVLVGGQQASRPDRRRRMTVVMAAAARTAAAAITHGFASQAPSPASVSAASRGSAAHKRSSARRRRSRRWPSGTGRVHGAEAIAVPCCQSRPSGMRGQQSSGALTRHPEQPRP